MRAFEHEMFRPEIAPRMKQSHDLACPRVDPGQVRAFVQIAAVTRQSEIVWVIGAAMLFRHDVLNMVSQIAIFLLQAAIFTAIGSPLPDKLPCGGVHLLLNR